MKKCWVYKKNAGALRNSHYFIQLFVSFCWNNFSPGIHFTDIICMFDFISFVLIFFFFFVTKERNLVGFTSIWLSKRFGQNFDVSNIIVELSVISILFNSIFLFSLNGGSSQEHPCWLAIPIGLRPTPPEIKSS